MSSSDAITENADTRKERQQLYWIPIILLGAVAIGTFVFPRLFGIDSRDIRAVIVPAYFLLLTLPDFISRKVDRRVAPSLTECAERLLEGTDHGISSVRIDHSIDGVSRTYWERWYRDVVISQRAVEQFTPEELDFALASAACRDIPTVSIARRALAVAIFAAAAMGTIIGTASLRIPALLPLGFGVGMGLPSIFLMRFTRREAERRLEADIAADNAALEITGNREAAESALEKMSTRRGKEERLRNMKNAEFRRAASILPPRGWKS